MNGLIKNLLPTFHPASPQAESISALFLVTLAICAAIFLLVTALVVYAAVRYRARAGDGEPPQRRGNRALEIGWTAIPLFLLAVLFVLTLETMQASDPPVADGAQPDLIVTGHQWWWEVRYPKSGVVTANEIHVPAGQKLLLRLESADVIHDFWAPRLARKVDMIPGHPNHLWLEVSQPGKYLGACSEFCGAEHAWMRFTVVAETPAAFGVWQRGQLGAPTPTASAEAARGQDLFRDKTCISCHAIRGLSSARIGPDLTHVASRQSLGAGVVANTRENLARWLAAPDRIKPGSHMPNLHLTSDEVRALTAYLETLR